VLEDVGDVAPDVPDDVEGDGDAADAEVPVTYVWPNEESRASSDPWIPEHHERIRQMRPRVMALNFVNAKTNGQMIAQMEAAVNAFAEGSRYHARTNPESPVFLQYEIAYAIDLRDDPPPDGWPFRNGTLYPREDPVEGYWGFDYEKLFTREYAEHYGIDDPDDPERALDLCELVDRGLVHEVWVFADGDVPDGSLAELLTLKPIYDADRRRREDRPMSRCAGNGCFDDEDEIPAHCTRTIHIQNFNHTRGVGCFLENFGHSWESIGERNPGVLPYLSRHFPTFANLDLRGRYGIPIESWYSCPYDGTACVSYPTETSAAYDIAGVAGVIDPYDPVCGNVHFIPNGRRHYDLESPATVLTTCEGYRLGEASGGEDLARPFSRTDFRFYERIAPDCMGQFLVWWYQNFPGLDNPATDLDGNPMLNWWPFWYY
jgi:hypothetical protein